MPEARNVPLSENSASFLRAARAGNVTELLELLKSGTDINTCNTNGLNALHIASKEGHAHIVEQLLRRGASVDAATKKGNTALHIASLAGQMDVIELLVEHGANVNVQSHDGFTPLYMAAQENHEKVVIYLLQHNANQSLATEEGFTPLAVALQQGHDRVVAILLENDSKGRVRLPALHIAAKKDDTKAATLLLQSDHNPDVTSMSGFTPLHIAAHYGNENIARLLLEKGANVNFTARHNITPLHVAAKWGRANLVSLLLAHGAVIDCRTRDLLTPLHCAARSGHDQIVDLLLEKGAPISAKTKNGLTPLHTAAQGDHVDTARILIYHRAPVDDVTVDYLTPLHIAAHYGYVQTAKLLLDRNCDPNARAMNGFTPLHVACKKNRIKVVELLLKYQAALEATTESGLTPLHVAAFMGRMNVVVYLLQHGANPDVVTVRGETPLHLAARAYQTDVVRILLRNGATVDAVAREGQTPLHIASRLGNTDIVMLLLQHNAKVDAPTRDHYTPLHVAAKEGQEEVALLLLDHNASPELKTSKGFQPIHLAAKYGNLPVVQTLLEKGANVDAEGKNQVTPLHVAAHYNHVKVALLLLEHGASPRATAKNGYTPLHIVAKKNQMDIAPVLMEYKADVNAESKGGFTPLHLASQEGHVEMVLFLLEHGAAVNAQAKNGLTPMHLCAQDDRVEVARVLKDHGADLNPQTKAGYTPLHVACHFGQINMVRFLLENGADLSLATHSGYTPLHQASQQGHGIIVKMLLDDGASPNVVTENGQIPLSIAQRLGYVTVADMLRPITEATVVPEAAAVSEERYHVLSPETMQEAFISESEDEGESTSPRSLEYDVDDGLSGLRPFSTLSDSHMYSTSPMMDTSFVGTLRHRSDSMKSSDYYGSFPRQRWDADYYDQLRYAEEGGMAGSASFEREMHHNIGALHEEVSLPMEKSLEADQLQLESLIRKVQEEPFTPSAADYHRLEDQYPADSMDAIRQALHSGFLVSFLVDARGGAMRGCRHSGVRIIVPPRKAPMPMRITCRYLRREKLIHPPPLNEGEALASRILEMGPAGAKFLGPVIIEVPHFASLRGREREIVLLRSEDGEHWKEHSLEATEDAVQEVLNESFNPEELSQIEDLNTTRITRILTNDFPQYFALVTRIRQEVHAVGPEGGMIASTVVPQVQALFPEGALTKTIRVSLQAQAIPQELVTKMQGNRVAVSPIVTVEPRRRKFHKPITLCIPLPQSTNKGMITQYSAQTGQDPPTLRLLCSIVGGTAPAQWEDITGTTQLTFSNDNVSFTTTVSARFWLMDCQTPRESARMAQDIYNEAVVVPYMAKFVAFALRVHPTEGQLRLFCVTDDKEDKTLERQEHYKEIARSRDVEVLAGRMQYLEFVGNLLPMTKSGEQLSMPFHPFQENRLMFVLKLRDTDDAEAAAVGRVAIMRESRQRSDNMLSQHPICTLAITLPDYTGPVGFGVDDVVSAERETPRLTAVSKGRPAAYAQPDRAMQNGLYGDRSVGGKVPVRDFGQYAADSVPPAKTTVVQRETVRVEQEPGALPVAQQRIAPSGVVEEHVLKKTPDRLDEAEAVEPARPDRRGINSGADKEALEPVMQRLDVVGDASKQGSLEGSVSSSEHSAETIVPAQGEKERGAHLPSAVRSKELWLSPSIPDAPTATTSTTVSPVKYVSDYVVKRQSPDDLSKANLLRYDDGGLVEKTSQDWVDLGGCKPGSVIEHTPEYTTTTATTTTVSSGGRRSVDRGSPSQVEITEMVTNDRRLSPSVIDQQSLYSDSLPILESSGGEEWRRPDEGLSMERVDVDLEKATSPVHDQPGYLRTIEEGHDVYRRAGREGERTDRPMDDELLGESRLWRKAETGDAPIGEERDSAVGGPYEDRLPKGPLSPTVESRSSSFVQPEPAVIREGDGGERAAGEGQPSSKRVGDGYGNEPLGAVRKKLDFADPVVSGIYMGCPVVSGATWAHRTPSDFEAIVTECETYLSAVQTTAGTPVVGGLFDSSPVVSSYAQGAVVAARGRSAVSASPETTQETETFEEGFIEDGKVVSTKKVMRVVTTTRTVKSGDDKTPVRETRVITQQVNDGPPTMVEEVVSSPGPSGVAGPTNEQPLIRLKVNDAVFNGVLDKNAHIQLTPAAATGEPTIGVGSAYGLSRRGADDTLPLNMQEMSPVAVEHHPPTIDSRAPLDVASSGRLSADEVEEPVSVRELIRQYEEAAAPLQRASPPALAEQVVAESWDHRYHFGDTIEPAYQICHSTVEEVAEAREEAEVGQQPIVETMIEEGDVALMHQYPPASTFSVDAAGQLLSSFVIDRAVAEAEREPLVEEAPKEVSYEGSVTEEESRREYFVPSPAGEADISLERRLSTLPSPPVSLEGNSEEEEAEEEEEKLPEVSIEEEVVTSEDAFRVAESEIGRAVEAVSTVETSVNLRAPHYEASHEQRLSISSTTQAMAEVREVCARLPQVASEFSSTSVHGEARIVIQSGVRTIATGLVESGYLREDEQPITMVDLSSANALTPSPDEALVQQELSRPSTLPLSARAVVGDQLPTVLTGSAFMPSPISSLSEEEKPLEQQREQETDVFQMPVELGLSAAIAGHYADASPVYGYSGTIEGVAMSPEPTRIVETTSEVSRSPSPPAYLESGVLDESASPTQRDLGPFGTGDKADSVATTTTSSGSSPSSGYGYTSVAERAAIAVPSEHAEVDVLARVEDWRHQQEEPPSDVPSPLSELPAELPPCAEEFEQPSGRELGYEPTSEPLETLSPVYIATSVDVLSDGRHFATRWEEPPGPPEEPAHLLGKQEEDTGIGLHLEERRAEARGALSSVADYSTGFDESLHLAVGSPMHTGRRSFSIDGAMQLEHSSEHESIRDYTSPSYEPSLPVEAISGVQDDVPKFPEVSGLVEMPTVSVQEAETAASSSPSVLPVEPPLEVSAELPKTIDVVESSLPEAPRVDGAPDSAQPLSGDLSFAESQPLSSVESIRVTHFESSEASERPATAVGVADESPVSVRSFVEHFEEISRIREPSAAAVEARKDLERSFAKRTVQLERRESSSPVSSVEDGVQVETADLPEGVRVTREIGVAEKFDSEEAVIAARVSCEDLLTLQLEPSGLEEHRVAEKDEQIASFEDVGIKEPSPIAESLPTSIEDTVHVEEGYESSPSVADASIEQPISNIDVADEADESILRLQPSGLEERPVLGDEVLRRSLSVPEEGEPAFLASYEGADLEFPEESPEFDTEHPSVTYYESAPGVDEPVETYVPPVDVMGESQSKSVVDSLYDGRSVLQLQPSGLEDGVLGIDYFSAPTKDEQTEVSLTTFEGADEVSESCVRDEVQESYKSAPLIEPGVADMSVSDVDAADESDSFRLPCEDLLTLRLEPSGIEERTAVGRSVPEGDEPAGYGYESVGEESVAFVPVQDRKLSSSSGSVGDVSEEHVELVDKSEQMSTTGLAWKPYDGRTILVLEPSGLEEQPAAWRDDFRLSSSMTAPDYVEPDAERPFVRDAGQEVLRESPSPVPTSSSDDLSIIEASEVPVSQFDVMEKPCPPYDGQSVLRLEPSGLEGDYHPGRMPSEEAFENYESQQTPAMLGEDEQITTSFTRPVGVPVEAIRVTHFDESSSTPVGSLGTSMTSVRDEGKVVAPFSSVGDEPLHMPIYGYSGTVEGVAEFVVFKGSDVGDLGGGLPMEVSPGEDKTVPAIGQAVGFVESSAPVDVPGHLIAESTIVLHRPEDMGDVELFPGADRYSMLSPIQGSPTTPPSHEGDRSEEEPHVEPDDLYSTSESLSTVRSVGPKESVPSRSESSLGTTIAVVGQADELSDTERTPGLSPPSQDYSISTYPVSTEMYKETVTSQRFDRSSSASIESQRFKAYIQSRESSDGVRSVEEVHASVEEPTASWSTEQPIYVAETEPKKEVKMTEKVMGLFGSVFHGFGKKDFAVLDKSQHKEVVQEQSGVAVVVHEDVAATDRQQPHILALRPEGLVELTGPVQVESADVQPEAEADRMSPSIESGMKSSTSTLVSDYQSEVCTSERGWVKSTYRVVVEKKKKSSSESMVGKDEAGDVLEPADQRPALPEQNKEVRFEIAKEEESEDAVGEQGLRSFLWIPFEGVEGLVDDALDEASSQLMRSRKAVADSDHSTGPQMQRLRSFERVQSMGVISAAESAVEDTIPGEKVDSQVAAELPETDLRMECEVRDGEECTEISSTFRVPAFEATDLSPLKTESKDLPKTDETDAGEQVVGLARADDLPDFVRDDVAVTQQVESEPSSGDRAQESTFVKSAEVVSDVASLVSQDEIVGGGGDHWPSESSEFHFSEVEKVSDLSAQEPLVRPFRIDDVLRDLADAAEKDFEEGQQEFISREIRSAFPLDHRRFEDMQGEGRSALVEPVTSDSPQEAQAVSYNFRRDSRTSSETQFRVPWLPSAHAVAEFEISVPKSVGDTEKAAGEAADLDEVRLVYSDILTRELHMDSPKRRSMSGSESGKSDELGTEDTEKVGMKQLADEASAPEEQFDVSHPWSPLRTFAEGVEHIVGKVEDTLSQYIEREVEKEAHTAVDGTQSVSSADEEKEFADLKLSESATVEHPAVSSPRMAVDAECTVESQISFTKLPVDSFAEGIEYVAGKTGDTLSQYVELETEKEAHAALDETQSVTSADKDEESTKLSEFGAVEQPVPSSSVEAVSAEFTEEQPSLPESPTERIKGIAAKIDDTLSQYMRPEADEEAHAAVDEIISVPSAYTDASTDLKLSESAAVERPASSSPELAVGTEFTEEASDVSYFKSPFDTFTEGIEYIAGKIDDVLPQYIEPEAEREAQAADDETADKYKDFADAKFSESAAIEQPAISSSVSAGFSEPVPESFPAQDEPPIDVGDAQVDLSPEAPLTFAGLGGAASVRSHEDISVFPSADRTYRRSSSFDDGLAFALGPKDTVVEESYAGDKVESVLSPERFDTFEPLIAHLERLHYEELGGEVFHRESCPPTEQQEEIPPVTEPEHLVDTVARLSEGDFSDAVETAPKLESADFSLLSEVVPSGRDIGGSEVSPKASSYGSGEARGDDITGQDMFVVSEQLPLSGHDSSPLAAGREMVEESRPLEEKEASIKQDIEIEEQLALLDSSPLAAGEEMAEEHRTAEEDAYMKQDILTIEEQLSLLDHGLYSLTADGEVAAEPRSPEKGEAFQNQDIKVEEHLPLPDSSPLAAGGDMMAEPGPLEEDTSIKPDIVTIEEQLPLPSDDASPLTAGEEVAEEPESVEEKTPGKDLLDYPGSAADQDRAETCITPAASFDIEEKDAEGTDEEWVVVVAQQDGDEPAASEAVIVSTDSLEFDEGAVVHDDNVTYAATQEPELDPVPEETSEEDSSSPNHRPLSKRFRCTTGSLDNVSDSASLLEFERLEREVGLREGVRSLSSSETELLLSQAKRHSSNTSQSSLAEFERLERELEENGSREKSSAAGQATEAPADVMVLSDIKEESESEDVTSSAGDQQPTLSVEGDKVLSDSGTATPECVFDDSTVDEVQRLMDVAEPCLMETSIDSLDGTAGSGQTPEIRLLRHDDGGSLEISQPDSHERTAGADRGDKGLKFIGDFALSDPDSLIASSVSEVSAEEEEMGGALDKTALISSDTVASFQEYGDEGERDSLCGDQTCQEELSTPVVESAPFFVTSGAEACVGGGSSGDGGGDDFPSTITRIVTRHSRDDGSLEVITRTVRTRVTDPISTRVRFIEPNAESTFVDPNASYSEFTSTDAMGNVTRTVIRRVSAHGSGIPVLDRASGEFSSLGETGSLPGSHSTDGVGENGSRQRPGDHWSRQGRRFSRENAHGDYNVREGGRQASSSSIRRQTVGDHGSEPKSPDSDGSVDSLNSNA